MSRTPPRIQSAPLGSSLWFSICNNTRRQRVRCIRFNSLPKLRKQRQRLQVQLAEKVSKSNNKLSYTTKGQLGTLRDLAAMEALGVTRGTINKTTGKGYDIHGFKGRVGIQLESKNINPKTTLSGHWIRKEVIDRFPREKPEAGSPRTLKVLVIPSFNPHSKLALRMKKLMDKRGIRVIQVDEQALTVDDALRLSKAVELQLKEILRDTQLDGLF